MMRTGKMRVILCAAELITPEIVNFMAKNGRGLICVALPEER